MMMKVRAATHDDIPQITEILNYYILNSVITFRIEQVSQSNIRDTYNSIKAQSLPFIVITDSDERVIGYTYASGYRIPYAGYSHTVEISVFVHPEYRSKGIGSLLMETLIPILKSPNKHGEYVSPHREEDPEGAPPITQVLAVMAIDPDGLNAGYGLRDFDTRWGFVEVGHLKKVGYKMGKWLDTLFMQLSLHE